MAFVTRRSFVTTSAALLPVAKSFAWEALSARNLGVQLYTVRSVIGKDPLKTLQAIEQVGYQNVEATYGDLDTVMNALQQTSLKPVSIHVDTQLFFDGGSKLADAFGKCKTYGFKYVVMPYIPPKQRGGADMFKKLADTLNKAGESANGMGMKLCYHNHAFEFQPIGDTTGLGILMDSTQKNLVSLEMDIFWVTVAGSKPVDLLHKYNGRVKLLHVKNKSASFTKTQFNENVPKDAFQDAASGSIELSPVLKAADLAGVEYYFVEQDQTPGDPLVSLKKSFDYLKPMFKS